MGDVPVIISYCCALFYYAKERYLPFVYLISKTDNTSYMYLYCSDETVNIDRTPLDDYYGLIGKVSVR